MDQDEEVQSRGAVDRALRLLQAILADEGRNTIGAVAENADLPLSTAHRLVATMVRHKLLTRTARGHYVAAQRLASAGGEGPARRGLALTARPVLRRLATASAAAAHLGVMDGDMVTYLVKESAGNRDLFTREGMQLEAYCSAVGKMLLAHLPGSALDSYFAGGPLVPLTSRTMTDELQLRAHLADVRRNQHAVDDREIADDLFCVAVPIRSAGGAVIAAISCSTAPDCAFESMVAHLREAAGAIEAAL
jgi:IclR family acetate operon transcriptional repressor